VHLSEGLGEICVAVLKALKYSVKQIILGKVQKSDE
jgi:hypothetical protein